MARKITFLQAVNEAMRQEMHRDPTVVVFGEDVLGGSGGEGEAEAWGGPAVELSAGFRGRVDQGDPYAPGCGGDGRGEPGGARADHGEVRPVSHRGPSPPAYGSRRPGAMAPGKPVGWGGR